MDGFNEKQLIPKVGVGVMILRRGRILLGRRIGSHGAATYGWAGGHLEFGETLEGCAGREVAEETGLVVTSLKLLCVSNILEYERHYVDFEFLADVEPGDPKVMEPDRVENWQWYPLDDLPSPLFRPVALAIESYLFGKMYHP